VFTKNLGILTSGFVSTPVSDVDVVPSSVETLLSVSLEVDMAFSVLSSLGII
jgi:hypothetical protein